MTTIELAAARGFMTNDEERAAKWLLDRAKIEAEILALTQDIAEFEADSKRDGFCLPVVDQWRDRLKVLKKRLALKRKGKHEPD